MTTIEKLEIIKRECNNLQFVKIKKYDEYYLYLTNIVKSKCSQQLHDIYLIMLEVEKFFPRAYVEIDNLNTINLNNKNEKIA